MALDVLKDAMPEINWHHDDIVRAHRIGRYNASQTRPKPLIVRFARWSDKMMVLTRGKESLRRKGVTVAGDLTDRQRQTVEEHSQQGLHAYFRGNRLVVAGPLRHRNPYHSNDTEVRRSHGELRQASTQNYGHERRDSDPAPFERLWGNGEYQPWSMSQFPSLPQRQVSRLDVSDDTSVHHRSTGGKQTASGTASRGTAGTRPASRVDGHSASVSITRPDDSEWQVVQRRRGGRQPAAGGTAARGSPRPVATSPPAPAQRELSPTPWSVSPRSSPPPVSVHYLSAPAAHPPHTPDSEHSASAPAPLSPHTPDSECSVSAPAPNPPKSPLSPGGTSDVDSTLRPDAAEAATPDRPTPASAQQTGGQAAKADSPVDTEAADIPGPSAERGHVQPADPNVGQKRKGLRSGSAPSTDGKRQTTLTESVSKPRDKRHVQAKTGNR